MFNEYFNDVHIEDHYKYLRGKQELIDYVQNVKIKPAQFYYMMTFLFYNMVKNENKKIRDEIIECAKNIYEKTKDYDEKQISNFKILLIESVNDITDERHQNLKNYIFTYFLNNYGMVNLKILLIELYIAHMKLLDVKTEDFEKNIRNNINVLEKMMENFV